MISIYSRFILILSFYLCLGLPKGLFPVGLPVKLLKALLLSSILVTCPAHLNLLDLITLTILGERYKLWVYNIYIQKRVKGIFQSGVAVIVCYGKLATMWWNLETFNKLPSKAGAFQYNEYHFQDSAGVYIYIVKG